MAACLVAYSLTACGFNDLKDPMFFSNVRQNSKLLKSTQLDDNTMKIIKKYGNLNPIIFNLLVMDSFDFSTEVGVNILGHIFEQSISDLEELYETTTSQRKKMVYFILQNTSRNISVKIQ